MDLQKKIISIALIIIILVGVIPPWKQSLTTEKYQHEKPLGYGFIFYPPRLSDDFYAYSVSIDFSRLFLQWVVVILVAGLLIFIKGRRINPNGVRDNMEKLRVMPPRQKKHAARRPLASCMNALNAK
jgi:hypothetical protein